MNKACTTAELVQNCTCDVESSLEHCERLSHNKKKLKNKLNWHGYD